MNTINAKNSFLTHKNIQERIEKLCDNYVSYDFADNSYEKRVYIKPIDDLNDLRRMNILKNRLLNIENKGDLLFFNDFFDLFEKSTFSYNLLSVLSIIYDSNIINTGAHTEGFPDKLDNDEKIKLLRKSFYIFKNLNNRDTVLASLIIEEWDDLAQILLNEKKLLGYLFFHPNLFKVKENGSIIDNIFPQLKDNQR